MKRLLVATDLSARSDRALSRAIALMGQLKAKLIVLHVVNEDLPPEIGKKMKNAAEGEVAHLLKGVPKRKRERIEERILFGEDYGAILGEASELKADLIILGTPRNDTLADYFIGTTAERVLREAGRPVLVVKSLVKTPYRRVLVGVDFSVYSRRALEFGLAFTPDAEFRLVHAFDVPVRRLFYGDIGLEKLNQVQQQEISQMVTEEMDSFLKNFDRPPPQLQHVTREGPVRQVIWDEVEKYQPDLLILGTHGRSGVAHTILGSVAEDLLVKIPCDVLTINAW